jgi:hypothetical protein
VLNSLAGFRRQHYGRRLAGRELAEGSSYSWGREYRALEFAERLVACKLRSHVRVVLNETANLGTFAPFCYIL